MVSPTDGVFCCEIIGEIFER